MRLFFVGSMLFLCISTSGQSDLVDSLRNTLSSIQNDSIRVTIYQQLAWQLKYSEPRTSMQYIDSALIISEELDNATRGNVLYYKGIIYYLTENFQEAITNSGLALSEYDQADNDYGRASIYNLLGLINTKIGAYEKAIQSYHQSLDFAASGDNLYAKSNPLHNIALIYLDTYDYPKSKEYALEALKVRLQIGDSTVIGQSYQTIGGIYYNLEHYDSAHFYLDKAEPIFRSSSDMNSLSITLSNHGQVFLAEKNYEKAKTSLVEAVAIARQLESNEDLVSALNNLSAVYQALEDYDSALVVAMESYEISSQNNLQLRIKESLNELVKIHKIQGSYQQAYLFSEKLRTVSDSLLNSQKLEQINNLEIQYQVEQKEQEISLQRSELETQEVELERSRILIFASIVTLVLSALLVVLWRSRLMKSQELQLQQQRTKAREAEISATISSQEKERLRFARDLHDGFGQMISILNMNIKGIDQGMGQKLQQESLDVIEEMYSELKGICFDLVPQTLSKYGLVSALSEFTDRVNSAGSVTLELNTFGLEDRLSETVETSLYRICQEWVNNILKYSEAKHITIQITQDPHELTLLIEDDGPGFDKSVLKSGKGHGWINITTRANLINGVIELETITGQQGTVLIINLPTSK